MKVVYIAGPFRPKRANDCWEMEQNIRRAEALAFEVWRLGAVALCPHCNTRFFQNALPDEVWLKGDLELVNRCDAVMLAPGWRLSSGTLAEVQRANELGIPVFEELAKLKAWL